MHLPQFGTTMPYLCRCNIKTEVNMWFAVLVFVCLATEVLSYLSGGEISIGAKKENM